MLKNHSIKSYALIAGLTTVLFLPVIADADRAADRAMKKDGRGLESTRGNDSIAENLKRQDGHPVGAAANQDAPGSSAAGQQFQTSTFLLGSQGNAGAEGKARITLPQTGLTQNLNQGMAEQNPGAKSIADTILRNHAPTQGR